MAQLLTIPLDQPAIHVDAAPGTQIVLRGSLYSKYDGSTIDAVSTTWPADAPGGPSVDSGGLIDLQAGGFHVVSRDPASHVVHAVAQDGPAPACAAHGVASPCLPLRVFPQATSRLITVQEWSQSLVGSVHVEVLQPPPYAPVMTFAQRAKPFVQAGAVVMLSVVLATVAAWLLWRRSRSPRAQLLALARRVREKALHADPILSAPLAPALHNALRAVREQRVQPESEEGRRVIEVLRRVDARLDQTAAQAKADDERRAADELVRDVEIALEAAGEAARLGR